MTHSSIQPIKNQPYHFIRHNNNDRFSFNQNSQAFNVSVPASSMLMGEHAVIYGKLAIACAVAQRIKVTLIARRDDRVEIDSALGYYCESLKLLPDDARLSYVLAAVQQVQTLAPSGFTLQIRSDFSHQVGLGSSAAVSAACVAVLRAFCGLETNKNVVLKHSLQVVHAVQNGRGSGTDLAASIFGGIVGYYSGATDLDFQLTSSASFPPMHLFYAGYKTKTVDVLKFVAQKAANHPKLYHHIYELMGQVSKQAATSILAHDWQTLGELMTIYQGLMDAISVNDAIMSHMIYQLRGYPNILAAKIVGSGLGDCVIALGELSADELNLMTQHYLHIPLALDQHGLILDDKPNH